MAIDSTRVISRRWWEQHVVESTVLCLRHGLHDPSRVQPKPICDDINYKGCEIGYYETTGSSD